jgi:ferrous iron transport protein B
VGPGALSEESVATRLPTVGLVGLPNAGKTTLMNALTGGGFRTANYPGVTVDLLEGRSAACFGPPMAVVDLPGVHSPAAPGPDETLACQVIEGRHPAVRPDTFIVVVDVLQLERHLRFAGYVARQGKPLAIALTMADLLPRTGQSVDPERLADALGVPVIPVDGRSGRGMAALMEVLHRQVGSTTPGPLADLPEDPVAGYRRIRDLLRRGGVRRRPPPVDAVTARIDRVALHPVVGFPIFLAVLLGLFAAVFWVARPFMDAVDAAFSWAGVTASMLLGQGLVGRFVGEALIAGVGVVAVFLPQILVLFLLMTLLEDSGYLARTAALVDRPLSALGLHGRSFVPMLSGFACAIPAILAARAVPTRRERLLTIWILPLMSCSARLPVYTLLLSALVPGPWKAGLALASIYVASLAVGAVMAGLVGRLLASSRVPSMLALELPAYRAPRWKPVLRLTWIQSAAYLSRAAGPIVVVACLLWVLTSVGLTWSPPDGGMPRPAGFALVDRDASLTADLARGLEPVLRPLGVDWRVGVGLLSAFAAREVFVSSMAIVFHVSDAGKTSQEDGLLQTMRTATLAGTGRPVFTTSSIVGLIVFFFLSLQCFSTVAMVRREVGSWTFALGQVAVYTGLGYGAAVAVVQGLRGLGVA